jgi:hypothetical protein
MAVETHCFGYQAREHSPPLPLPPRLADLYTHVAEKADTDAATRLDALLFPAL